MNLVSMEADFNVELSVILPCLRIKRRQSTAQNPRWPPVNIVIIFNIVNIVQYK